MTKGYEIAIRKHELAPHFVARASLDSKIIPGRMYVHVYGLNEAFPTESNSRIEQALNHSLEVVKTFSELDESKGTNYVLTIVWGLEGNKMVDLLKVSGIDTTDTEKWPGNPEVPVYIFRNGVYQPDIKQICEDGGIMLGIEGMYRRKRKNLKDYLANPPKIEGLNFSRV